MISSPRSEHQARRNGGRIAAISGSGAGVCRIAIFERVNALGEATAAIPNS
jgi:hypothetical protein